MPNKIKVIAFYLPQFHEIPENNMWWGEKFTEWVNVKKALPLFKGHKQPKIPLNENYYDLLSDDVKIWQANLAKKYGIYGFCYYHYWFNGKMLLEKPMEQMLSNLDVDIPFCISWANVSWTKEWVGDAKKVLIPQTYGGETDWNNHYNYLKSFFMDKRYIKKDGKPLFIIYNPLDMPDCIEMMEFFNKRAEEDGMNGICFAYQTLGLDLVGNNELKNKFDYDIEFQPSYALYEHDRNRFKVLRGIKHCFVDIFGQFFDKTMRIDLTQALNPQNKARQIDYDAVWNTILKAKPVSEKSIPGAFVRWDNTPRKGNRGLVYINNTPAKFKHYFEKQVERTVTDYKEDMLFIYAWNEWAEGGFLEPDEEYRFEYLEAIKNVVDNKNKV